MSVTYTVTEDNGHVHTRTSKGHTAPQYAYAVVRRPGGKKHDVSYCRTHALAVTALGQAERHVYQGEFTYPNAKLYPVTATVK